MPSKKILIIPARLGSRRIKKKNFFKLEGKMLIDYVVENALKTKIFNKIIITTDNKNYLEKNNFKSNKKIIFDYRD